MLWEYLYQKSLRLHSGEGPNEHAKLVMAIERANKASLASDEEDENIKPW